MNRYSRRLRIVTVLTLLLAVMGCGDWERRTFQTLATSDRVITQASQEYNAGRIPQVGVNYDLILQAQRVQYAAVQAFDSYWAVKLATQKALAAGTLDKTTARARLAAAQSAVLQALVELPAVVAAVKRIKATTAGSGPPTTGSQLPSVTIFSGATSHTIEAISWDEEVAIAGRVMRLRDAYPHLYQAAQEAKAGAAWQ